MGFSDTWTTEGDNDPNSIIQHSIKQKNYHIIFPLVSIFFFFQYLLSKPVLIWNKSLGSVKHQVVDWSSLSNNRWLKHFMTNRHGTIAGQTIFHLLLYTVTATNLGSSNSYSPEPGPHLLNKGMKKPAAGVLVPTPWLLFRPDSQWEFTSGSWRKSSAFHFRQETWETLVLKKRCNLCFMF